MRARGAGGGYLASYERAQRLRVWDTIEKAAAEDRR